MTEGRAKFRIEGEDATAAAFKAVLGNAQATASRIGGIFSTAIAGFSIASVAAVARHSIEMGDELNKAAIKAGVAGKTISELAYAAKMADVDLGSLSTSLRFMQKNLSEGASGGKAQKETFDALGLSIAKLRALKPDEQFELLADRISQLQDPADRARAATELFGRAGGELLPLFEQGAAGIRAAREEAERLGLAFGDEQLKRLADADDAIKRMKASAEGLGVTLTALVAPAISEWAKNTQLLAEALRQGGSWLDVHREFLRLQAGAGGAESKANRTGRIQRPGNAPGFGGSADDLTFFNPTAKRLLGPLEAQDLADRRAIGAAADEMFTTFFEDFEAQAVEGGETYLQRLRDLFLDEWETDQPKYRAIVENNSEYAREAMRGIQGDLKEFFLDPAKDGVKGLGRAAVDTFRNALAEIAAARASKYLFGKIDGDGISTGGLFSGALNSLFGGFMADGGKLQQGKWYVAGEHGPEPIWGGGPGAYATGYGGGGGGMVVAPTYHISISGESDLARALPAILDEHAKRTASLAVSTVRNGYARGRWRPT